MEEAARGKKIIAGAESSSGHVILARSGLLGRGSIGGVGMHIELSDSQHYPPLGTTSCDWVPQSRVATARCLMSDSPAGLLDDDSRSNQRSRSSSKSTPLGGRSAFAERVAPQDGVGAGSDRAVRPPGSLRTVFLPVLTAPIVRRARPTACDLLPIVAVAEAREERGERHTDHKHIDQSEPRFTRPSAARASWDGCKGVAKGSGRGRWLGDSLVGRLWRRALASPPGKPTVKQRDRSEEHDYCGCKWSADRDENI